MNRLERIFNLDVDDSTAATVYLLDIAFAAKRVRELQRTYFANRTRDNLIASKEAERALDKLLAEPA